MPSFEIPDGPAQIPLSGDDPAAPRVGGAVFGVTNRSTASVTGRFGVQVAGDSRAEWFSIEGERERPFTAGESQTIRVSIKVPPTVASGSYKFRLRVVGVNDPDNDHMESPVSTVVIQPAAAPPPPGKPFPWWIVAVAAGTLAVIVFLFTAFVAPGWMLPEKVMEPAKVQIPAIEAEDTFASMKAKLEAAQFVATEEKAAAATGKLPGRVVDLAPKPWTPTAVGTNVTVFTDPGVPMPNFAGKDVKSAAVLANEKGIFVDFVMTCLPGIIQPELIVAQSVPKDTPVAKASRQVLTYMVGAGFNRMCGTRLWKFEEVTSLPAGGVANTMRAGAYKLNPIMP